LMGLLGAVDVERRVLLGETREAGADLLFVAPRPGEDRQRVDGLRQLDPRLRLGRAVADGIAGQGVGELGDGPDVTRAGLGGVGVLLTAGEEERPDALVG